MSIPGMQENQSLCALVALPPQLQHTRCECDHRDRLGEHRIRRRCSTTIRTHTHSKTIWMIMIELRRIAVQEEEDHGSPPRDRVRNMTIKVLLVARKGGLLSPNHPKPKPKPHAPRSDPLLLRVLRRRTGSQRPLPKPVRTNPKRSPRAVRRSQVWGCLKHSGERKRVQVQVQRMTTRRRKRKWLL